MNIYQIIASGTQCMVDKWKKSPSTVIATGFTAIPAAEMAIWAVGRLVKKHSGSFKEGDLRELNYQLSGDLAGCILYSFCACNPIPNSRLLGTICFIGYSIFWANPAANINNKSPYLTSKCVYIPTDLAWNHVVVPISNHIFFPP